MRTNSSSSCGVEDGLLLYRITYNSKYTRVSTLPRHRRVLRSAAAAVVAAVLRFSGEHTINTRLCNRNGRLQPAVNPCYSIEATLFVRNDFCIWRGSSLTKNRRKSRLFFLHDSCCACTWAMGCFIPRQKEQCNFGFSPNQFFWERS